MQSYLKHKRYYDKKATVTPLKINDYCYVLNPKADNQSMKFAFKDCIWMGPYVVVKVLSNNNYVVRRTGTRYTQTLHRIRLRLYAPNQRVPDVTVKVEDQLPDPEVKTTTDHATAITTADGDITTDKTSSGDNTSFNLDASDNPFKMTPPPVESPPLPTTLPPIVIGYNPRKTGRYNLRPNPRPNAHPDFRMLDAITTEGSSQTQN